MQYPGQPNAPVLFAYQYDVMGRPEELTETQCTAFDSNGYCSNWSTAPVVENAAYNAAGQMTSLLWATYPNRLTAAAATGGQWGQAYTFDGFGNLTSKTVTAGSGSNWSNASSASTNRLIGQSYDANGNALFNGTSYDVENRLTARTMTQSGPYQYYPYTAYQYDPMGHRVGMLMWDGANTATQQWTFSFYDVTGRVGATVTAMTPAACGNQTQVFCPYASFFAYFAGRRVLWGQSLFTDRLGSVRGVEGAYPAEPVNYLPYGEVQSGGAGATDISFATYLRDSTPDNQDYANQRYYNPWMGRFNSADPGRGSTPDDPASWNKYTYTHDDPVNRYDPSGRDDCTAWEGNAEINGFACGVSWCPDLLSGNVIPNGGDPLAMLTCQEAVSQALTPSTVAPPPQAVECSSIAVTPTGYEYDELAVLFGEDSWTLGYSFNEVVQEDLWMINAMYNQTYLWHFAHNQAGVDKTIQAGAYLGFSNNVGPTKLNAAIASSADSTDCLHLMEAEADFNIFWSGSQPLFPGYAHWVSKAKRTRPSPTDVTIAGTTFFGAPVVHLPNRHQP